MDLHVEISMYLFDPGIPLVVCLVGIFTSSSSGYLGRPGLAS